MSNGVDDASIYPPGIALASVAARLQIIAISYFFPPKRPRPIFFSRPTKKPSSVCIIMKYEQCKMESTTLLYILQE